MPTLSTPSADQGNDMPHIDSLASDRASAATEVQWTSRSLRGVTGWACRWLDLLILQTGFFGTLVWNYFQQSELPFSQFFQLRVSLRNLLIAVGCVAIWRALLRVSGVYDLERIASFRNYALRVVAATACCSVVVGLFEHAFRPQSLAKQITLVFWIVTLLAMSCSRALLLYFDRSIRPHLRAKRNLVIVGSGSRAVDVYNDMKANRDLDYNLVGYVDSDPVAGFVAPDQIIGPIDQLESILMHGEIDEVVIALPMKSQYQTIADTIATCERVGVQSQYFTHHFGGAVTKKRRNAGGAFSNRTGRMVLETVHLDGRRFIKRFVDFAGALFGILALSPLLLATALAVKLTSPGPIIFRQQRYGFGKRKFSMLKFRSMVIDAEARQKELEHLNELDGPAFKIANDPRVTPIGNFIRKMSIDELPQLFNVLLGDMSLVGPRPMPLRDVSRFSEAWLMRRFSVKPGLTCLWQASGRSNLDFDRWIELDLEYIDNWSMSLDFEILFRTVPAVLKGRGAS